MPSIQRRTAILSALPLTLACLATACAHSPNEDGLRQRAQRQLGAPDNTLVFGFESTEYWNSSGPALELRSTATEGASSLGFSPSGWTTLSTVPLTMTGRIDEVSFDVLLPVTQPNPDWHGQVHLTISAPSANIYDAYSGPIELKNEPKGEWTNFHFSVSDYVGQALEDRTYDDLKITIAFNSPAGSSEHLVDRLRISGENQLPLDVLVTTSAELSTPTHVAPTESSHIPLPVAPADPNEPESVALAFFESYQESYGLSVPAEELSVAKVSVDEAASAEEQMTHVRVQQSHQGLEIFGAQAWVHLNADGSVRRVSGHLIPTPSSINPSPVLTEAEAIAKVEPLAHPNNVTGEENLKIVLGIFSPRLAQIGEGDPVLAYQVGALGLRSFVDANTGDVLLVSDRSQHALDRRVHHLNGAVEDNLNLSDATLVIDESMDNACRSQSEPVAQLCSVYENVTGIHNYFWIEHGRDGHDGDGSPIDLGVHWGGRADNSAAGLARSWTQPASLLFTENYVNDEIVGHEFAHLVVFSELDAGPRTAKAAAISESLADIFSWLSTGKTFLSVPPGETGPCATRNDIYRNLRYPEDCGGVSHFRDYDETKGAHLNGLILSRAATALAFGEDGTTPPVEPFFLEEGIGEEKVGQLFYQLVRNGMTATSDFHDVAISLSRICDDFVRTNQYGFTYTTCFQVRQVIAGTGMIGDFQWGLTRAPSGESIPVGDLGSGVSYEPRTPVRIDWVIDGVPTPSTFNVTPGEHIVEALITFSQGVKARARRRFIGE